MKTRIIGLLLVLCTAWSVQAASPLRIKASKQLESKRSGGSQGGLGGSTSTTEKEYFYRFETQAIGPQGVGKLKFEWAVMMEDWQGKLLLGTYGLCQTNVTQVRAVAIETDSVKLNERTWQGAGGHAGKVQDKLAGYGLKVWDEHGNLLVEEYEPVSMKKEIDWKKVTEQPSREDALRAIQTLLGGDRDRRPPGPPPGRRRD